MLVFDVYALCLQFDVANFELFSNLPKDLMVSGSHRYPTREWTPLARVTGQEGNRGVQSFPIETEDFFKYIRVSCLYKILITLLSYSSFLTQCIYPDSQNSSLYVIIKPLLLYCDECLFIT